MTQTFETELGGIAGIEAVPTILDVVCKVTGMGFAAVARVTETRWIACSVRDEIAFGLSPGGELKVETTICSEVRKHRAPIVINDVSEDPFYSVHPSPKLYKFQSYISVPIVLPDGTVFGTLCAIDPRPNLLDRPEIVGMFKLFAEMIAFQLNAMAKVGSSEASLAAERETAVLREQFIAVLAHDLRNPLASIDAATRIIAQTPINDRASGVLVLMQRSVVRMSGLINNVMDFARGRMGGGMRLVQDAAGPLEPVLEQVISEMRAVWPERPIEAAFAMNEPVACDHSRIGQLFSNLLGNALTHGAQDQPVRVAASSGGGVFELAVANGGLPLPDVARERLFQPFFRGDVKPNQEGLGLGLFIAAEIARAHGGTLGVTSTAAETRFTLRIPTAAAETLTRQEHILS